MSEHDTDMVMGTDRRSILKVGATLGTLGITGLAGCSGGGGGGTPDIQTGGPSTPVDSLPEGGTFVVGAKQGIQTMSPFRGFLADYLIGEAMYDRLTRVDQEFEVHPNLAKDWEANSDFTTYTFMLNENATFSSEIGSPQVTAQDVKATYDFLMSDAYAGSASSLSDVESVSVVDDTTVEIKLANSDIDFPKRISETGGAFFVAPKSVLEDDPSKLEETDYGSGPLQLTEWNQKNNIRFEAVSDYHIDGVNGNPLPYFDKLHWNILSDEIQRANKLAGGSIDAVSRLSPKVAGRAGEGSTLVKQPSGLQFPIVLDTTIEPFDKPAVREAVKYALDREAIMKAVAPDAVLGHHSGITPIHTYYNEDLDVGDTFGTTADIEMAKQKLSEAGEAGGFDVKTFYYDDGVPSKSVIAQLFQQQMKEIGINFEIQQLTEETWLSNYWNVDGEWYITNYSTRVLGETVLKLALRCEGPWNEGNWCNQEFTEAYKAAASATDTETKRENLYKCQEINHREGPWVGTFHPKLYGGYKSYVENYNLYPTYIKDFISRCAVDK